jgi:hypothetical protein
MKVVRPRDVSPGASTGGSSHVKGPKEKKEPTWITNYIHLVCGCVTTPQTIEVYRLWQPKRGVYFCENHGKWIKKEPPPTPAPLPDVPLF